MVIRPLNAELETEAKKIINENPERRSADLAYIREWLEKQPHLRTRTDDQWLIAFLRGCKFSLERTKEKLDMYYTIERMVPKYYQWANPCDPKMKKMLKTGYITPLPLAAPDAPRVLFFREGVIDPSEIDIEEIMSIYTLFMKYLIMNDDNAIISGIHCVADMDGFSLRHCINVTPPVIKKIVTVFQDVMPIRLQSLHYVKLPLFFESLFKVMRSFLSEKLNKRIHLHSDLEGLQEYFPKSILPKDIGGDGPTFDELTNTWIKKLEDFQSWFEDDIKYGCDESKRPGKPKTTGEIFGLEGSFRSLSLD